MSSDPRRGRPARSCAILAGGRASRLGGRKADATLAGRPLVEHLAETARRAGLEPLVVAKPETSLEGVSAPVLREPALPFHPLLGIATALESLAEPLVCTPCDLPLLPAAALRSLARRPGPTVVEHDGRLQPLLGRFEPALAAELAGGAASGRPATEAVLAAGAEPIGFGELGIEGDPGLALSNVNDAEALRRAESYLLGS